MLMIYTNSPQPAVLSQKSMFDMILSHENALLNTCLACMPRGKPRNFFHITPQTLQAHPKYPWGVWESMDERVPQRNIECSRLSQGDASFTYPAKACTTSVPRQAFVPTQIQHPVRMQACKWAPFRSRDICSMGMKETSPTDYSLCAWRTFSPLNLVFLKKRDLSVIVWLHVRESVMDWL